jgi:predicted MFS family arabinose efflux permease
MEEPSVPANRFGIIKAISWFYLAFGLVFVWLSLAGAQMAGQRLEPLTAVLPGIMALGALGTLRKKNWGRRISYFTSAVILIGVPIGTFIGGFMIYHLNRNKDLFMGPSLERTES